MSTDALVILKNDHKEIRKLFRDFRSAGDNAVKTKSAIVDKIITALTVHTYIENEVMYPRVRELLPDLEDDVLESYEEHHVADVLAHQRREVGTGVLQAQVIVAAGVAVGHRHGARQRHRQLSLHVERRSACPGARVDWRLPRAHGRRRPRARRGGCGSRPRPWRER